MDRYYGRSNQHTLWNILPTPTVKNIGGIGYINPVHAIQFPLAFAVDFEDFAIDFAQDNDSTDDGVDVPKEKVVLHIPDSKVCRDWKDELRSNDDPGSQQHRPNKALLAWANDWKDGFGANRTKQNRKSTDAMTFSCSTPKNRINSIDNTLPIAIGLKKNPNWHLVAQQFRDDMEQLGNGLTVLMAYHGRLKKVIPVFVRRVACLTDKVERADYTSTLSCTSKLHRCFGKIISFDAPSFDVPAISQFLGCQRAGNDDINLRQYGWCNGLVDATKNGGRLPSCYSCRKKNIQSIRSWDSLLPPVADPSSCDDCANWCIDDRTKEFLSFNPPKAYPTVGLPNCHLVPPVGREVGLLSLQMLVLSFESLVQAGKYAFFNCYEAKGRGWNKETCKAYLRVCGYSTKEQEALYDAARKDFTNNTAIDYGPESRHLGSYTFPAAWFGELPLQQFIEMLMHLLFLGVAESNFNLCNKYLKDTPGPGVETYKKNVHELLKALTKFNLSWLLALPFSGSKKTKFTTGTWVSENWLAWVRLSKVTCVWFVSNTAAERRGGNDVVRMIACFTAMVANLLSHSGATRASITLIEMLVKEFLSSVRELDTRVRYKEMNKLATRGALSTGGTGTNTVGDDKSQDQFWLKSNFLSLLNLAHLIEILGPLINYWDGGGRAERYIQEIKPHIPRGVRDGGLFFIRLLEKIFKLKALGIIEESCSSEDLYEPKQQPPTREVSSSSSNGSRSGRENSTAASSSTSSNVIIEATIPTTINVGETSDGEGASNADVYREEELQWSAPMEDAQMSKARTIYIYKRRTELEEAIDNHEPIAAIVTRSSNGSAEAYAVYKRPRKRFGWMKLSFQDEEGVLKCGLFYSPLTLSEPKRKAPKTFKRTQSVAKMSAIAIPLKHSLGIGHGDANKYCVITNWWRERNRKGLYVLPTLDFERYHERTERSTSNNNTDN